MTDEEAAAIQARAEQATAGPWVVLPPDDPYSFEGFGIITEQHDDIVLAHASQYDDYPAYGVVAEENAAFIAASREDIPALLAERAALLEIVRAVAALKDEWFGSERNGVRVGGWAYASEDVVPLVGAARALLTGDGKEDAS